MEAATAADLTLRYLVGYITLGSRVMISKGYVSDLTVVSVIVVLFPHCRFGCLGRGTYVLRAQSYWSECCMGSNAGDSQIRPRQC